MNSLTIDILRFVAKEGKTDSDKVIEKFNEYHKDDVLTAIKPLLGPNAADGYVLWHQQTMSYDLPEYDVLQILQKGQEFLDSF